MKTRLIGLGIVAMSIALSMASCDKEDDGRNFRVVPNDGLHTILQLKVDPRLGIVEGIHIDTIDGYTNTADTIPLAYEYMAPGDFGYIRLMYGPTGQTVFHGGIIWMGCGEVEYPQNYFPGDSVALGSALPYPGADRFRYECFPCEPMDMEESQSRNMWSIINRLQPVHEYAGSGRKISVLPWQPSTGVGDPNDFRLIVFLER